MIDKFDLLMVGVGGQGIVLASDVLGETAIAAGYDIKKTDTLGMAQRGGSVVSHIRISDHVWSPLIPEGNVDILIAFEKLEAARWASYLKPDGKVLINNTSIPPLSVSLGTSRYPDDDEIRDIFKPFTRTVHFVNGTNKAKEVGDARTLNILMLGCLSVFLPIDISIWLNCLAKKLPNQIIQINTKAFELGRMETSNVNL